MRAAKLFDHTVIHHHDLVAHLHRFQLIMRHVNRGRPHPIMQGTQFHRHMFAKFRVQRAQRFVHHEGFGIANNGAAKGYALPVATRQPADRTVKNAFDPQYRRHFGHFGAHLILGHALADQRIADVAAHVQMRIKREHLEHEGDVALTGRLLRHFFAVDPDFARGWQFQPCNHPQSGGLAAARRAKQHEKLTVFDGETG